MGYMTKSDFPDVKFINTQRIFKTHNRIHWVAHSESFLIPAHVAQNWGFTVWLGWGTSPNRDPAFCEIT